MKTAAVLTCLLLAGCASTPTEFVAEGKPASYVLKQTPELAAGCMARNAENREYIGNVRRLESNSYEISLRNLFGVLFVYATTEPQGAGGSKATIWPRPQWFIGQDTIAETMTKGC